MHLRLLALSTAAALILGHSVARAQELEFSDVNGKLLRNAVKVCGVRGDAAVDALVAGFGEASQFLGMRRLPQGNVVAVFMKDPTRSISLGGEEIRTFGELCGDLQNAREARFMTQETDPRACGRAIASLYETRRALKNFPFRCARKAAAF